MKKIFRVCIALLLCFSLVTPAFALDGIWHNPYGIDDLYDHEPTEIYPLTPIAGEMIYIKSTTWPVEAGQSVWLTYTKNGEPQPDIGAEWKYNSGNNSYWEAAIGPFEKGDVIEYTVFADKDGQNTQSIGPFSFHVVEWERAQSVELGSQEDGLVVLNVTSDQGDSTPKLGLSFPSADVLRFQFSPLGDVAFEAGAADYSIEEDSNSIIISTSALEVTVTKSPYGVEVRDLDTGKLLTQNGGTGSELSWLTDGAGFVKNFTDLGSVITELKSVEKRWIFTFITSTRIRAKEAIWPYRFSIPARDTACILIPPITLSSIWQTAIRTSIPLP